MRTEIFDFDGVLSNSFPCREEYCRKAAEKHGIKLAMKIREAMTCPLAAFLKNLGFPEEVIPEVAEGYEAELKVYTCRLFPGIPEMLEKLKARGDRMIIISSNWGANIARNLHGLDKLFDSVITRDDFYPKSRAFNFVKGWLGDREYVSVGDSDLDYESSVQAGISRFIGVDYGSYVWLPGHKDSRFPIASSVAELEKMLLE